MTGFKFIIAAYVNGEDNLPLLFPANDIDQAANMAYYRAGLDKLPIVRVFAVDEEALRPVILVRKERK